MVGGEIPNKSLAENNSKTAIVNLSLFHGGNFLSYEV